MPGVSMAEENEIIVSPEATKKMKKEKPSKDEKDAETVKEKKKSKKEKEEVEEEADVEISETKKRKKKNSDDVQAEANGEASETPKKKKSKKNKEEENETPTDGSSKKKTQAATASTDTVKNVKASDENGVEEEEFNPFSLTEFRITESIRKKLELKGIKALFPIQAKTFDIIFDGGDIVARARTGQGKTLAFVLPILNRMLEDKPVTSHNLRQPSGRLPSVLALAPTRELAKQVALDFEYFSDVIGLTTLCVYGGVPIPPQEKALKRGVDVVVGTPGRIKDLIERGKLNLSQVKYRILDEADEMLNMGFVDDVELILGKVDDAEKVQTLLFSATMPEWVNKISKRFFKPNKVVVDLVGNEKQKANENIKHYALRAHWSQRSQVVTDVIRCYGKNGRVIVFAETKRDCDELVNELAHVSACVIHGDVSQNVRETTLEGFRSGKSKVLVATDVAARGLDISDVELVIQIEPPRTDETYIHRSGRTGRAGNKGVSVMLFTPKKQYMIRSLERNCGVVFEHISPPNTTDVANASVHVAVDAIKAVSDNVVDYFREAAQKLIDEGSPPVDLLAKAMAKIVGYSDLKDRSLITSQENYTTLQYKSTSEIRSPVFVMSYLRRVIPEASMNEVKKILITKDNMGAVFDVPSSLANDFINASKASSDENGQSNPLIKVTVLPELLRRDLLDGDSAFGNDGRGGGGYRGGGRGGRGGYGNGGYGGRDRRGGGGGGRRGGGGWNR